MIALTALRLAADGDPIDNSLFYFKSLVYEYDDDGIILGGQPRIHLACCIVAALILCLYLKQDTDGTLVSGYPIECFLLPANGASKRMLVWRCFTALLRQLVCKSNVSSNHVALDSVLGSHGLAPSVRRGCTSHHRAGVVGDWRRLLVHIVQQHRGYRAQQARSYSKPD